MSTPAVTYTPAQVTHAEEMKKVLIEVFADDRTYMNSLASAQLYAWARNLVPSELAVARRVPA